jgi:NDP-sugar pyrophosphorylase family protein
MLTVIMPAAGKGSRLSLPYPKEIYNIDRDKALIDFSFDHFKNYGREAVQFVVIINEHKTEIVKYLAKYKDRYNISFTYQNPEELEYTGAIKSARHLFTDDNIVLLPDSILKLKDGDDLYQKIKTTLPLSGFCFFFKKENRHHMLKTKGAIYQSADIVTVYEDKPSHNLDRFNAYWCAFAFSADSFDRVIEYMEKSTNGADVNFEDIKSTAMYNSKGIEVEDYLDLGTWEELKRFVGEQ